ncbi:polysaccharide biosynthesis/export family protein [Paraburkholderia azotifigens]|uniref:Exopolysaccharide biosynthesis protein n=1 Tax=Paraburkholderia azotifigens TaxID=2057004 RepID=A0A5C6VAC9_9BURK|nr:polysaccharide biosynthesis/export family protein [Paraburkholderia azotifigens]TXC82353.1 exopolysaccharide biosynthesis protein [Paraburkholderia azotifigens]
MLNRSVGSLAVVVLVSGCASAPGNYLDTSRLETHSSSQSSDVYPVKAIDAELITEQAGTRAEADRLQSNKADTLANVGKYEYRVAPQDILGITVWDHPELTTPSQSTYSAGGNTTQSLAGALQQPYTTPLPGQSDPYGQTVAADGSIFIPFAGRLSVAGKTVVQIREQVTASLVRYVRNPQVDVRVLSFRSQKVQVTGEVKAPGPLAISDVPLTLVDAITRSGGNTAEADLQRVRLIRKKHLYLLDANRMLDKGDMTQDVLLQSGDVINVPDRVDSRVFVMGEVKTPTPLTMYKGRLSIADALTQAGGILDTDANPRQIYVMRGMKEKPTTPEVFHLDMTQPESIMLSTQFQLQPMDVVYVGTASSTTFNRVLQQVLPSLQTLFYLKQLAR